MASGQTQQAFDYTETYQEDSQFAQSRELGAHEGSHGLFSPGLTQSSHYYQVHSQRQTSNSQYSKAADRAPKLMKNLHTSLMDSEVSVQAHGQQPEGLSVDRNVL